MRSAIPNYDESVEQESRERNDAYLGLPSIICGVEVRQMTPIDNARLTHYASPFLCGGNFGYPHIAQFIYALSEHPPIGFWRKLWIRLTKDEGWQIRDAIMRVATTPLDDAGNQIAAYLQQTFRDAPTGDADDAPIACGAAWLEYRMQQTFGWPRETTLNTPYRVIYQQLRCWQKDNGSIVVNNLSGKANADWLANIQEEFTAGRVNQDMLDQMNAMWLKQQEKN